LACALQLLDRGQAADWDPAQFLLQQIDRDAHQAERPGQSIAEQQIVFEQLGAAWRESVANGD